MNPITYIRDTTYAITFTYQKNGVNSSAGITLLFTVKPAPGYDSDSSDGGAIIKKNITMSGPTVSFTIDPTDVAATVAPGKNYVYDFKVVETLGPPPVIYSGGTGKFILVANPTNRT